MGTSAFARGMCTNIAFPEILSIKQGYVGNADIPIIPDVLCRKLLSAFESSSSQYLAAVFGAHSLSETVFL